MRPKHTERGTFRIWSLGRGKFIKVPGYHITRHFALTRTPEFGSSRTLEFGSSRWTITHKRTGASVVWGIGDRRVAEIAAVVHEHLPINWDALSLSGDVLTPESDIELQKAPGLWAWRYALMYSQKIPAGKDVPWRRFLSGNWPYLSRLI